MLAQFKRDRKKYKYLSDQARNPGALNFGNRARRFGAKTFYEFRGNKTAIFRNRSHGAAALMDLILMRKGRKIRSYIGGGEDIRPRDSYSGGQNYQGYLQNMRRFGVDIDEVIDGSLDQLRRMVDAHRRAEGSEPQYRLTSTELNVAFIIVQSASEYVEGTELDEIEIL